MLVINAIEITKRFIIGSPISLNESPTQSPTTEAFRIVDY